ncbi:hypothetical protein [uncultured Parasphingorhabdus sp.]|uniref:hypothetical protein n=1 Tax=uncultured Parasphingorhabdus sp. TaxID=2709694 RepID=UPI0030DB7773
MTFRVSSLFILATCLAITSPAVAREKNPTEVRAISQDYADCVVRKKTELAREAILSNVNNEQIENQYRRLIIGDCLVRANDGEGARMAFGGDLYRYALAGALIRLDLQNHVPRSFEDVPALTHLPAITPNPDLMNRTDRKGRKYQEAVAKLKTVRILSLYGECVVREDPQNSYDLAMAEVGSTEEAQSFAKLQQAFGACLNNEGQIAFNKSILKGLVNVNYYRLAMAMQQENMTEATGLEVSN